MSTRSIRNIELPSGKYLGTWTSDQVLLTNGYAFQTNVAVKGTNIPVAVKVSNSKATVYDNMEELLKAEGNMELPTWAKQYAKYLPVAGAGLGLLVAFRRKSGFLGAIGYGIIGLGAGVGVAMLFGEKDFLSMFNLNDYFSSTLPPADPAKIQEVIDYGKANIPNFKEADAKQFLAGFTSRDMNVMLEVIKWRKENNFPANESELRTRLKAIGLTESLCTDYLSVFPVWNNIIPIFN